MTREIVLSGDTALGIELGSTRIKAVLIGPDNKPLFTGGHAWKPRLLDGVWTYDLDDVWTGVQAAYADLAARVEAEHGIALETVGAMGISGMMHGYLAFDEAGQLLVPFRTWQNTFTGQAATELTTLFQHTIPQRWSVAHLFQAILGGEDHVGSVNFMTTLSGYVHRRLTGERALGIGDASGMFPIDVATATYNQQMLRQFDEVVAGHGHSLTVKALLPRVLTAGQHAGTLTEAGARLLDPSGKLRAGISMAPPEGDAGTGMVATNSVAVRTANVSAGTSIFAMAVLERTPKRLHEEIDLVTTPAGDLVAMVHCNNGAADLQSWVGLFSDFAEALGSSTDANSVFELLYRAALEGDPDGGGMLAYGYLTGEHIVGMEKGAPLFVRTQDSEFTLANFMRTHLFATFGALRIGMDLLRRDEGIVLDSLFAHGGLFKTEGVAQSFLAAALDTPVSVGQVAAEGGAWGMALLASFLRSGQSDLAAWLAETVFNGADTHTVAPVPADVEGFNQFMDRYRAGLAIERAAIDVL